MDKVQTNQPNQTSNQSDKPRSDDLPGTSRDPTGRVISDKPSQGKGRQDQGSNPQRGGSDQPRSGSDQQRGGSDQRGSSGYRPESDTRKGS